MKDWALILGSSSGFGAAACRELAARGVNIYGIHLDRRASIDSVNLLIEELKNNTLVSNIVKTILDNGESTHQPTSTIFSIFF